tara:strand:- start:9 stop:143 length:135 start_codon:yes stop_codon:yes gene_type:complete
LEHKKTVIKEIKNSTIQEFINKREIKKTQGSIGIWKKIKKFLKF